MATTTTGVRPSDVLHAVLAHPWRLLVPAVLTTLLALGFVLMRQPSWEASQALMVRDEAAGNRLTRPGKFDRIEEMKSVQETILELAHSRGVLEQALIEVGPPADDKLTEAWPSIKDIEALQEECKLAPPKGAEFGKTEVFYLKVQAKSKERAVALASAVSRHLQSRFEDLRKTRAKGVTDELVKTVSLAEADLATSTANLAAMEKKAGRDLSDLRMLNESPSGESDLRKMSMELETELRTQKASLYSNRELLKLLEDASDDPGRLLASPSRLLESQAGLKRLKDGLIDAQLASAKLQGSMLSSHPLVQAAKAAELEVSQHLHDELAIAIKGVEVDVRLSENRIRTLEKQRNVLDERRDRISDLRANYANLVSMTRHRTDILKTAQLELSEAQATAAAAHRASLITLVDAPDIGSRPIGPGRTTIVLAGFVGGLVIGAALIFLSIDGHSPHLPQHASDVIRLRFAKVRQSLGKVNGNPAAAAN